MADVRYTSGIDQSGFERDAHSMFGKMTALNGKLVGAFNTALSTAGVGGIGAMVLKVAEAADELQDLADRYGESASGLQRVGNVAKVTGTDMESVAMAAQRLRVALVDAERGGKAQADALSAMGLSAKELVGLALPDLMVKLSEGYQRAELRGQGLWALQQLMGRGAGDMLAQMRMGPDALAEAYGAASAASDDSIKRMADVASAWKNLKSAFTAGAIEIGGSLMRGIGGALEWIRGKITGDTERVFRRMEEKAKESEAAAAPQQTQTQQTLLDSEKKRLDVVNARLEAEREASELALASDQERLKILEQRLAAAQREGVQAGGDAAAAERVLEAAIKEVQISREIELTRRRIAEAKQKEAGKAAAGEGASKDDRIRAYIDQGMSISEARSAVRQEDKTQRSRNRIRDRYERTKGDRPSLIDDPNQATDQAGYVRRGSLIDEYGQVQGTRPGDVTRRAGTVGAGASGVRAGGAMAGPGEATAGVAEASGGEGGQAAVVKLLEEIKAIMAAETE